MGLGGLLDGVQLASSMFLRRVLQGIGAFASEFFRMHRWPPVESARFFLRRLEVGLEEAKKESGVEKLRDRKIGPEPQQH